jgi:hypothetical protein
MPRKLIDLTGQTFGMWTVLNFDEEKSDSIRKYWRCQCECGTIRTVLLSSLKTGSSKCCGCIRKDTPNIVGKVFGMWTVLKLDHKKGKEYIWECQCKCGTTRLITTNYLKYIKSCGCEKTRKEPDIKGQSFGRLIALEIIPAKLNKDNAIHWKCICDCGAITTPSYQNLIKGNTKSCGNFLSKECINRSIIHGHTSIVRQGSKYSRTYKTWRSMIDRCFDPKSQAYHNYGGRGITVCDRWLKFENFLEDMGERPKGLTIERVNNMDGYYKENCIYTTMRENTWNKRNSFLITYRGETKCLSEWIYILTQEGKPPLVTPSGIIYRLKKGWSVQESFYTPSLRPKK